MIIRSVLLKLVKHDEYADLVFAANQNSVLKIL